ncbi:uncharacterized protein CLUP02_07521 [Colletotrichum lupini]|uniref:Uncharacterized protein n=1 Tax=Colletotrichum lupini TaxID=145971 RepID=A0A9Q8SRD9_9PEZI|nr:uncharacterized protein CLUP02_07521 [Colletotrichum lupini]UQC82035.1 hypothetical protein CLUP02_07521 [Colletotrichum lupini]
MAWMRICYMRGPTANQLVHGVLESIRYWYGMWTFHGILIDKSRATPCRRGGSTHLELRLPHFRLRCVGKGGIFGGGAAQRAHPPRYARHLRRNSANLQFHLILRPPLVSISPAVANIFSPLCATCLACHNVPAPLAHESITP